MSTSHDDIQARASVALDIPGQRYTLGVDGSVIGFTAFRDLDGQRIFFHTEIDDAYAGHHLSSVLVKAALDDVRTRGLRFVPVCPLVAAYANKHPEVQDIADAATPQILEFLDRELG
ncbi:GNAT family N-acetyltransferase [Rhodococcoides kyotonense]|uniref:N-acetyltransferase domain-containing protein n=1 Tax=Rhodococcoides kyotonense TaxID=398843 RepID=A0A239CJ54_9NOCA|nr:GNAT family N-acetyltransferase [Rhodococcus kyotonensis]SNS19383.1 hypothetical protein SAMN05421642_10111 [Rhodococcus kyotonensis]